MSVERTDQGRWRARWRDPDGRQRSKVHARKADAERHLATIHADMLRGSYVTPSRGRITVADWADEWLAGAMNLGPGGRETYRRDLDRHILPTLGHLPIGSVTASTVERFLADELDRFAASTVLRHYRTIRRMMQIAVDRGRLQRNPCDPVTPPKMPHSEMRFLTVEEVDALAEKITDRYRVWVLSAAYLGFRWSEGVGLRRGSVDGARVTISEQLIRRGDKQWHRSPPKTKTGRRVISAPGFLVDEMVGHMEDWAMAGADGLVFPNRLGQPLNGPSFRGSVFKPALKRAGLNPAIRIHDLRHTAVALAIAAGAHSKAIQLRMGHASIAVTLDRYGHLFPHLEDQIAEGLDDLRSH